MPSFSTHYIFAKEMMPFLKDTADFNIKENTVLLGAQGPDIFFFHRVFPWMHGKSLRKCGSALHRTKPEILFENMRQYCSISKNQDIAKSYVYGFILHYTLDRNCHPYVYYLQNEITKKYKLTNPHTAHNIVEFSMDSYLLYKRMDIREPLKFDTAKTLNSNKSETAEIGRLLEYVVSKTLNSNITDAQAETALQDIKYIQKLIFDPKGIKRILLTPLEILIAPLSRNFKFTAMMRPKDLEKAKKYANIENAKWKSPYNSDIRTESFEELFELSKDDAKRMINAFQNGKSCREITENKSFLTGVEIK